MWYAFIILVACSSLNVFLVPHTHIDAGWIDTPDHYYSIYASPILNNIIRLLDEFPRCKFVWSEAVFLHRFLSEFPASIPKLKQFIAEGRLEIVGGGWVMNDEALVDFEGVTRQIIAGHRFFKEALGVENITVAWQLDSFGHSSLTPALFEKMGFKYLVMSRIHGEYKVQYIQEALKKSRNMEFLWRTYGLGDSQGVFTHLLHKDYSLPEFLNPKSYRRCFEQDFIQFHEIENW